MPSQSWLAKHFSRLCPGCSNAIVSLSIRCNKCRSLNSSSDVVQSAPESGVLSDASSFDSSDSESDHEGVYEVDEILKCRKSGRLVEYLVAWKGYSADANSWEPAGGLTGAKEAIALFNSNQPKRGSEKPSPLKPRAGTKPKDLPLPVPRATGIPQLERNNVVQVGLGTSRLALDALLPVILLPSSNSGLCEAKQSNLTTPDAAQVVSSLLCTCLPEIRDQREHEYTTHEIGERE